MRVLFSSLTPQTQDGVPKQECGDTDLMMFDYVTDMSSKAIIMVVDFAKKLPGFLTLSTQDQITLLKASCLEVMVSYFPMIKNYFVHKQCIFACFLYKYLCQQGVFIYLDV